MNFLDEVLKSRPRLTVTASGLDEPGDVGQGFHLVLPALRGRDQGFKFLLGIPDFTHRRHRCPSIKSQCLANRDFIIQEPRFAVRDRLAQGGRYRREVDFVAVFEIVATFVKLPKPPRVFVAVDNGNQSRGPAISRLF